MSCEFCATTFIKQKLGRCQQCMGLNLALLLIALTVYLWIDIASLLAVQKVALMLFIGGSALLMCLHLIAWCFYRITDRDSSS